jgi:hypothetical protein
MLASFPEDGLHRIKQLFEDEEWEEMVKSKNVLRMIDENKKPITDETSYLDVNHFYSIFDKYYDTLIDVTDLTEDQVKEGKKTILTWINSIKGIPDPVSHPTDQELSLDDASTMIEGAHKVVTKFDLRAALDILEYLPQLKLIMSCN